MFSTITLPDIPGLPPLGAMLDAVAAGVFFLCLAATVFGPFMAACAESLGRARGRMVHIKAARQNAAMSLALALPVSLALAVFTYCLVRDETSLRAAPYGPPLLAALAVAALAVGLLALYCATWKKSGMPGAGHAAIGFLAFLSGLAAGFTILALAHRSLHGDLSGGPSPAAAAGSGFPSLAESADFFLFPADSFFWPVLAHLLPLAAGAAGAFSALWTILFRARNDFGRDYYHFALPFSAKWALAGTFLSLPTLAFAYARAGAFMLPELSHAPSPLLGGLCYGLPASACLCWLLLLRGDAPLRHKPGIVLAFFCLWGGLFAQALALNEILPSP
jgi:hypothetical protein